MERAALTEPTSRAESSGESEVDSTSHSLWRAARGYILSRAADSPVAAWLDSTARSDRSWHVSMPGADPLLGRDQFPTDAVSGAVAAFNSAMAECPKGLPGLWGLVARP